MAVCDVLAASEGFVTPRSEDPDSTYRPPTAWDALFGCVFGLHAYRLRPPTVDP
jgi:hypothetical protein